MQLVFVETADFFHGTMVPNHLEPSQNYVKSRCRFIYLAWSWPDDAKALYDVVSLIKCSVMHWCFFSLVILKGLNGPYMLHKIH